MAWLPIWKRVEYDIKQAAQLDGDSVRYRIRVIDDIQDAGDPTEGEVIHEGIATTSTAGGQSIIISPNEVAADYLSAPFQNTTGGGWHSQLLGRIFCLDYYEESGNLWLNETQWYLYGDWSYDYDFNIEAMGLSHPVRAIAAPNQWLVASVVDWDEVLAVQFLLTFANGNTLTISRDLYRAADFNADFNADFATTEGEHSLTGYVALYLGAYTGLARVQVIYPTDSVVIADYKVAEQACKRYALYYRNAYGGMDSLLLDGVQRKETYARSLVTRKIDNSVRGARAVQNYRNALTEGWELRLNNLTDAEAARMHHLVGSAEVYLCDLIADTLTPLVLTDTECIDRTFANGRKRIDWKLAATTAQVMRRE